MAADVPIIYIRGFAGETAGINEAVDDPFYGFNSGSTHVRVGRGGDPVFYQFESPLLRLMLDHGYQLYVKGGQLAWLTAQPDGSVPAGTIWIHRFYDRSASSWGGRPEEFSLETAAQDLLALVTLVRAKTGAPRVHLVAHSMGGLIGRCLLQKVIPDHVRVGGTAEQAADVVDKFFTYATPHGGIEFAVGLGLLERLRDTFGIAGADIFGPQRMWQYLTPVGGPRKAPKGWRPQEMPDGAFPKDRIFTLVGTNPGDYDVAMGLSSRAVGVKSDGLVQIENAAIPGARSAYVHRSHSGRYGIVNSEEGYQNLRRFLFGNLNVRTELVGLDLSAGRRGDLVWQAEAELAVRGLPVLMHEQVAAHHCPIQLEPTDHTVQLAATGLFMDPLARPDHAARSRLTLRVRVLALAERRGIFDFTHHLEHGAEFDDQLVVDVGALDGRPAVWAVWGSQIRVLTRDYEPSGPPLRDEDPTVGTWSATMPLPPSATALLGADAAIRITARPN